MIDPNRVHKVFHLVAYAGRTFGPFITDLQSDEGQWYLVFEWETNHDGEFPRRRVAIAPDLLEEGGPGFVLQFPVRVDDPGLGEWLSLRVSSE